MGKKADKQAARQAEAERRNAPVHLLIAINNMAMQVMYGLEGNTVLQGVKIPSLSMGTPARDKKAMEQMARVIRWTAACMEKHGFSFSGKPPAGLWRMGEEKIHLISNAISHYVPGIAYEHRVIVQMIVAETAWCGCRVNLGDNSREAKYLQSTLDTFTSKFTDGEDELSRWATDVYMAIGGILNGSEPLRKVDFNAIPAWFGGVATA